ncbi:hypothetical protein LJR039_007378 [Pseudorhodoferax sp. LjRoot39]|uniref:hypothetical protein n=1 Tax=Pseudorhodoferax sp. LjRoot39 TaxID=3342328 RepID=UPI003ECCE23E
MDWNQLMGAAALAVSAVAMTINYAALDDAKRARVGAFWARAVNVGAVVLALGISLITILVFWLSDGPISRSAVVNLGIHFFNLGIWATLWFLSIAAKSMANAKTERKALQERVVALEVQLLANRLVVTDPV